MSKHIHAEDLSMLILQRTLLSSLQMLLICSKALKFKTLEFSASKQHVQEAHRLQHCESVVSSLHHMHPTAQSRIKGQTT